MRRPTHVAGIATVLLLISGAAHAQSVDDVVANNLKSKGGVAKIKATNTVRMTGSVVARDMNGRDLTGTMTIVAKRPNLMRRDATVNGQQMTNAFDGTMSVSSPDGGPTIITLEVPCLLSDSSSPRTAPSSVPG